MGLLGMALEGGGARGSYQAGAAKALFSKGYNIHGFVGSSIGAINGALLAQDELEKLLELWSTIEVSTLFDIDDDIAEYILNLRFDKLDITKVYSVISKTVSERGADTTKIRKLLTEFINEDRIRKSGKDYGLVTVSIPDFKHYELMLDEIPNGQLIDYIMASSSFPGFKSAQIGTKSFIDGGFYDNLPLNMLAKRGYKDIFAVRTSSPGIIRKLEYKDINVKYIEPMDSLGQIMHFSSKQASININLGYYDTYRMVDQLSGQKYYIQPIAEDFVFGILKSFDDIIIEGIAKPLGINEKVNKRLFFEKVLPTITRRLRLPKNTTYSEFIINILEYVAEKWNVPRFEIYDFHSFYHVIRDAIDSTPIEKSQITPILTAILRLISALGEELS